MLSFRPMSPARFDNSAPGSSPIQFGTAEYLGSPGADHCQFCQQPITGTYYRVHGAMACRGCAEKAQSELPQYSHADYLRGLLYGVGAAIAGLILYAAFEIATSLIIGYVSLAVGWMVGKAMMKGSNGVGGKRYQITAVLLTYAAVSTAAVPVVIHYTRGHRRQTQAQQQKLQDKQRQLESEFGQKPKLPQPPKMGLGAALGRLALLGLA